MNWKCNFIPLKKQCSLRRVDSFRFKPVWFSKRHQPKPFSLVSAISSTISCLYLLNICLQHLTPSTTAYFSKDCLPGSVLLTLLSSGFNPVSLLSFSINTSEESSQSCPLTCGAPQGSVFGPIVFIL